MAKYIMALDAGTTSNRAILFDEKAGIVSVSQAEFPQYFPEPGLVDLGVHEACGRTGHGEGACGV